MQYMIMALAFFMVVMVMAIFYGNGDRRDRYSDGL